jgi:protein-S-isoprenylcysteine O-methyltransferase Ste14
MKLKFFIDANKIITFLVILSMVAIYHRWQNPTAWVYLALHGTYGLLWVIKSNLFPDASWERKTSIWFGLVSWFSLALYWFPAWWITRMDIIAPPWVLSFAISLNIIGTFFVFTSDMQKFTELKLNPGMLITTGMFRLSRNINYFGEFLIYFSFALLPMVWFAYLPLAAFMITFWIPNMARKDRAISSLPGFAEYKKKTRFFFPFLF